MGSIKQDILSPSVREIFNGDIESLISFLACEIEKKWLDVKVQNFGFSLQMAHKWHIWWFTSQRAIFIHNMKNILTSQSGYDDETK